MSGDVMSFPPSWEDFTEQYSFNDSDEVYTNGSRLMQLFRVEQMVKHYFAEPLTRPMVTRCRDCKYYHDGTSNGRRYAEPYCLAIGELAYGALFEVDEDCFCSWGERKEVGK